MRNFEKLEDRLVLSSTPMFTLSRRLDDGRVHELDECYIANPNDDGGFERGWAESHSKESQQTTRLEPLPFHRPEAEIILGDAVFFFYDRHRISQFSPSGGVGQQIWKVTCNEVTHVANLSPFGRLNGLTSGHSPSDVHAAGDHLYFFADEDYRPFPNPEDLPRGNYELWRTDGSTEGTEPSTSIAGLTRLLQVEALADTGKHLFAGETEEGRSIWLADTNSQSAVPVVSQWTGELLVTSDGHYFYTVATDDGQVELRVGDVDTPHLSTVFSGQVQSITEIKDGVYFVADQDLYRVREGEVERVASAASILGATSTRLLVQSPEGRFLVGGEDALSEPFQTSEAFLASDNDNFYFAADTREEVFVDPISIKRNGQAFDGPAAGLSNEILLVTHAVDIFQLGEDAKFRRVGTVEYSDEYGAVLMTTRTLGIQTVRDGLVVKLWHEDDDATRRWITHHHIPIATPQSERLAGDINLDGVVDFTDFLQVAERFPTYADSRWEDGDFSGDRQVDFIDFLLLVHNYGREAT